MSGHPMNEKPVGGTMFELPSSQGMIFSGFDDVQGRQRYAWRTSLIFGAAALAIFVFSLIDAIPIPNWMSAVTLSTTLVMALTGLAAAALNRRVFRPRAIQLLLLVLWLGGLVIVFMTSGLGLILAVTVFTLSISIAVQALPLRSANLFVAAGTITASLIYLAEIFLPYSRDVASAGIEEVLPWVVGGVVLIFGVFMVQRFRQFPLLMKIVVPFVALLLVVIGALAFVNNLTVRAALTAAANEKLSSAGMQTAAEVDARITQLAERLAVESNLPGLVSYLDLPVSQRAGSEEEAYAQNLLENLQQRGVLLSYSLMDPSGNVLLTTDTRDPDLRAAIPASLGIDLADRTFLQMALNSGSGYISPVLYQGGAAPVMYFVHAVQNSQGVSTGALAARFPVREFQTKIFEPSAGMAGLSSYALLFSENSVRLADGSGAESLDRLAAPQAEAETFSLVDQTRLPDLPLDQLSTSDIGLKQQLTALDLRLAGGANLASLGFQLGEQGKDIILQGVVVPLATRNGWKVVYLQEQRVLLAPVDANLRNTGLLIFGLVVVSMGLASLIARAVTLPVQTLTQRTRRVLEGDLTTQTTVASQDEIGLLAESFNAMTMQLSQTLSGLEQRVESRTAELEQANAQTRKKVEELETIADIVRAVAAEHDLEKLLTLITHTISERFKFYHVGIFLLDNKKEFAVLRAANSEGGQRMLARGHRLAVGQQGIVGYATGRALPRVALDVGQDAVYFDNPDMPMTRSELALPLLSSGTVIGALDVQSTQPSAFNQDDVSILTILADQVTIAIENARLFQATNQALDDLQGVQRQYLREKWLSETAGRAANGFAYERGAVKRLAPEREPVEPQVEGPADLVVTPIQLRGEVIGQIDLQKDGERVWNDEERRLIAAVAEQVGLALENARLLEETQRRAERESLVAQITTRLRASNDPQQILQTAVTELKRALRAQTAHVAIPGTGTPGPDAATEEQK